MIRIGLRALVAGMTGAVVGGLGFVAASIWHPSQTFEMDRDLPDIAVGFYPSERNGRETFIWTDRRAQVTLTGLDRNIEWACRVRFRGGRY